MPGGPSIGDGTSPESGEQGLRDGRGADRYARGMDEAVARSALAAWDLEAVDLRPITIGLINTTYRVETDRAAYALQRLHPVFSGEVNDDIDAITRHLEAKGLTTPRIVRTRTGATWHEAGDGAWRVLTWIEGESRHRADSLPSLRSAGALVARFHEALTDLHHDFAFCRPGAHDTAAHLQRLGGALTRHRGHRRYETLRPLAEAILAHPLPAVEPQPTRIVHGDLKLSNVLFRGSDAVALVDLDTLQRGSLAVELGDALRSWCNPAGEDCIDSAIDLDRFEAAMSGYLSGARRWLRPTELDAVVAGVETIALELASRFCLDAFEESYFRWDRRFESASHHNEARARGQLSFARSVAAARDDLRARLARLAETAPIPRA